MTFLTNPHRFGAPPPPPPEFESIYESKQALTTVQPTRMIDWFSGCSLNAERWFEQCETGCGAFAMVNAADEGFEVQAGGTSANCSLINYNGVRHYCECSSVWIALVRTTTCVSLLEVGFIHRQDIPGGNSTNSKLRETRSFTCLQALTNDGVASTVTSTCVATSCNWYLSRTVLTACNNAFFIDGSAVVCQTTRLPDQPLQPHFREFNNGGGANGARIKYFEAYNV